MLKHYHGDRLPRPDPAGMGRRSGVRRYGGRGLRHRSADLARRRFSPDSAPAVTFPFPSCPWLSQLRFLEANGFTTYIASPGDRDFMRPFAQDLYGIPPERVIGSSLGLDFKGESDDTQLLYKSKIEFFDDGPEKPVRIWSRTGRRPLVAGGNSNGDIPMLRFARTPERNGLKLLLLHDDDHREFAYTAGAEEALEAGQDRRLDGHQHERRLGRRLREQLDVSTGSPMTDRRSVPAANRRYWHYSRVPLSERVPSHHKPPACR